MYTLKIRWTRHERVTRNEGTANDAVMTVKVETDGGEVATAGNVVPVAETYMQMVDESTLFIPARTVTVHGAIGVGERLTKFKSWDEGIDGGYMNYLNSFDTGDTGYEDIGRLIHVVNPEGRDEWYLASQAWLLGPSGDTIERVAP